jgi:hypothetical protein
MTDPDIQNSECFSKIQISQQLLQCLKKEMTDLNNLLSQAFIIAYNLEGTWTAIRVTYENWQRDIDIEKP